MIWQKVSLYGKEKVGEDKLDNAVTEDVLLKSAIGRLTEWTADDVNLLGREATTNNRKLITKATRDIIAKARRVVVDGETYEIVAVLDSNPRWRVLSIRKWKK